MQITKLIDRLYEIYDCEGDLEVAIDRDGISFEPSPRIGDWWGEGREVAL